jgi:hypothetical protein
MAFWHLPRPRPHYVTVSEKPLTEAELCRALAADVENVPTFDAVLQVIAALLAECDEGASASVGNPGLCASEVGGAATLRELRAKLLELRQLGQHD